MQKNILTILVLILLLLVVYDKCYHQVDAPDEPIIIRDTTWVIKDSVIVTKPQVVKTIDVESHDTIMYQYIPDTNYAKLVLQYQEVVYQLLAKNIMQDSIRIDSNGYVKITDTVQKNLITGRSTQVNIKYPVIKETVIMPPKKVNQVYFGGNMQANSNMQQIGIAALYKTKKDFIMSGMVSVNNTGTPLYGMGAYWKIKLKN